MPASTQRTAKRNGSLLVIMDSDQREEIDAGAQRAGMPTGTWLRMLGLREARKAAAKKGRGSGI